MAETEIPEIPEHFADHRLVEEMVRHQGAVDADQLQAAGYSLADIHHLLADRVLVPDTSPAEAGHLVFPEPTLYIDTLVLIQWRLPQGVFGGRTALVFHELSVVWPKEIDVCVPDELVEWVRAEMPRDLGVLPFTLPDALRTYGVTQVYPSQPGDVPVAMYSPAVAVAQTLAEPYYTEEVQEDCVDTYIQDYGVDAALREAVALYGVEARFQALLARWHSREHGGDRLSGACCLM